MKTLADGRGFEPRVPFGTHAFQACTIDRSVTHPLRRSTSDHLSFRRSERASLLSKLQSPEQFVERQLEADEKLSEIGKFCAHSIETHLINDGFDLERVAREQRDAPLRVVQAS